MKKIALLLLSLAITCAIWFAGVQTIYAHLMVFPANVLLQVAGSEASISVDRAEDTYRFRVDTIVEDHHANFFQAFHTLLYPTVMVLAWLVFMAFTLGWKRALSNTGYVLLPFFGLQVIFLLLLTGHLSPLYNYFYYLLHDSFYVVAVIIIIITHMRLPVFGK